jgi:mono/diheme cytochrome c family protein
MISRVVLGCVALAFATTTVAIGRTAEDAGERLYNSQCARCHGPEGRGGRGPKLVPFKLSDQEAFRLIRMPECDMPPFPESELSDKDVQEILSYLRALN